MSEQPHVADVPASGLPAARVVRAAHPATPYEAGDRIWLYDGDGESPGVVTGCRALPTGGWVVHCHAADGEGWEAVVGFDDLGRPFDDAWIAPRPA